MHVCLVRLLCYVCAHGFADRLSMISTGNAFRWRSSLRDSDMLHQCTRATVAHGVTLGSLIPILNRSIPFPIVFSSCFLMWVYPRINLPVVPHEAVAEVSE